MSTQIQDGFPRRIQAVDHVVDVLEVLEKLGPECGVTEISKQVSITKASVHHILKTLEARGLVAQNSETSLYRLSWKLYELGCSVRRDLNLERTALPYMGVLASRTGETVLLSIIDDDTLLYIESSDAPNSLRISARAGKRAPLHATASGKVLIAFSKDRQLFDRITQNPLPKWTPFTIVSKELLRTEIDMAKKQGYAMCWGEREIGLASLAVPIKDYSGIVVASLAIAGSDSRLTKKSYKTHLAVLLEAQLKIETELGAGNMNLRKLVN